MTRKLLHICNGDCSADLLRDAGVPGERLVYCDLLHEGPVPRGVPDEEYRQARAEHFERRGWASGEGFAAWLERNMAMRAMATRFDEVVLWFEHDLYDQLLLIHHLDWFFRNGFPMTPPGSTRVSLVCIGEHPEVKRFLGLGQLTAAQHAALLKKRQPITELEYAVGREAWAAFTAPDPTALAEFVARPELDAKPLPFLRAALVRVLEEYPSKRNGLSRTQSQILEIVNAGIARPVEMFRAHQDREEAPFLGDSTFYTDIEDLCVSSIPMLGRVDGAAFERSRGWPAVVPRNFAEQKLALSDAGRKVVKGELDFIALNGIDRWIGGVHLCGPTARWRWDEESRSMLDV